MRKAIATKKDQRTGNHDKITAEKYIVQERWVRAFTVTAVTGNSTVYIGTVKRPD